jgi:mRNA-degrading endonuclease RelE of RelBE toxin-antitoxin system
MTDLGPYRIMLAPGAKRALAERLPPAVAAAIWEFIAGPLAENPHRVGKELLEPLKGLWSARRGTYRILYRIFESGWIIRVEKIDHRADVYRP